MLRIIATVAVCLCASSAFADNQYTILSAADGQSWDTKYVTSGAVLSDVSNGMSSQRWRLVQWQISNDTYIQSVGSTGKCLASPNNSVRAALILKPCDLTGFDRSQVWYHRLKAGVPGNGQYIFQNALNLMCVSELVLGSTKLPLIQDWCSTAPFPPQLWRGYNNDYGYWE